MIEMLREVGVNWHDYPAFFTRGTFIQRRQVTRRFSAAELEKLPAQHQAHTQPNLMLTRKETARLEMPPFRTVTNRVGVIFHGEAPEVSSISV